MSRIRVIDYKHSTGNLRRIYDELITARGKLAGVHCIQSLRPDSIVKHIDLYMEIMFSRSELSRAEREMMAVVVSATNHCEYCGTHHSEALGKYWKDDNKISQLRCDFERAELTDRELQLCRFSQSLTVNPGLSGKTDTTQSLRKSGLSDNGILDATLVVSYFNFVNRIVLALDVNLEPDRGAGYNY
jgi:uncharacterized peroxidase-related enzyme